MSTATAAITTCPDLQGWITEGFLVCEASRRLDSPAFNFLISDTNRSNLRSMVNPEPGRKRTVQLVYDQPVSVGDVEDVVSCDRVCTATTKRGDLSETYTIDCTDGRYIEEKITLSDWNESCRTDGEVIRRKIINMLDGLMPAVYTKIAEELNPLVGGWGSDVDASWLDVNKYLKVKTKKDSSDDLNTQAFQRVNVAKMQAGVCAGTFMAGGIDMYMYWQVMNAGCCTQDGIDALKFFEQYGEAVTYDRYLASEFGNDISLLFQQGAVQILTYNAVTRAINDIGLAQMDMSYRNFWEGIIYDPRTGMPIDISIKQDCGDVHIVMTATAKAVALPYNLYPTGHPLDGVNSLFGINVENA